MRPRRWPEGSVSREATVKCQDEVSTTCVSGWDKIARRMWNDTDLPLGYLITFRCYGTWLHGDERGSVDREHNRYKSPFAAPNQNRRRHNLNSLKSGPVLLNAEQRASVEKAIGDTCSHRKWQLYACNVRTNHVHSVISIGSKK